MGPVVGTALGGCLALCKHFLFAHLEEELCTDQAEHTVPAVQAGHVYEHLKLIPYTFFCAHNTTTKWANPQCAEQSGPLLCPSLAQLCCCL